MDTRISGAILADAKKLLEHELNERDNAVQCNYGKYLSTPFRVFPPPNNVAFPREVRHIIATDAGEGNMVKKSSPSL